MSKFNLFEQLETDGWEEENGKFYKFKLKYIFIFSKTGAHELDAYDNIVIQDTETFCNIDLHLGLHGQPESQSEYDYLINKTIPQAIEYLKGDLFYKPKDSKPRKKLIRYSKRTR